MIDLSLTLSTYIYIYVIYIQIWSIYCINIYLTTITGLDQLYAKKDLHRSPPSDTAQTQVEQLRAAEISGYAVKRLLSVTCDAIVRLNDDAWTWPPKNGGKVGPTWF